MNADEIARINEEIIFWENNMFGICILNKLPDHIPDNFSIKRLLVQLRDDRNYYAIAHRLSLLRKAIRDKAMASDEE